MTIPGPGDIQRDVVATLRRIGPRPIEPTLESEIVADLGFDSLHVLELVAALEDHFDISIPLEQMPPIRTVEEIIAHVGERLQQRTSL